MWFVYMIFTEKKRFYTGIATDVERRFVEHLCDPSKGAKFFRSDRPIVVVYCEEFSNRSEASKREAAIKKLSRIGKEKLVKIPLDLL
jgi:putative endonuclease